jgi:hypothetical protein
MKFCISISIDILRLQKKQISTGTSDKILEIEEKTAVSSI